jgi:hypothetical protein
VEIGKSKLVLDHLIVGKIDDEQLDKLDLSAIIKFGAEKLFKESDAESSGSIVQYDENSIDKLLDRDNIMREEKEKEALKSKNAESDSTSAMNSFSFAKVWTVDGIAENDAISTEPNNTAENLPTPMDDVEFWDSLLKDKIENEKSSHDYISLIDEGIGKRRRKAVDYAESSKKTKLVDDSSDIENYDDVDGIDKEYIYVEHLSDVSDVSTTSVGIEEDLNGDALRFQKLEKSNSKVLSEIEQNHLAEPFINTWIPWMTSNKSFDTLDSNVTCWVFSYLLII